MMIYDEVAGRNARIFGPTKKGLGVQLVTPNLQAGVDVHPAMPGLLPLLLLLPGS